MMMQRSSRRVWTNMREPTGLTQVRKEAIDPLLGQKADHWTRVSLPNKATKHLQEKMGRMLQWGSSSLF